MNSGVLATLDCGILTTLDLTSLNGRLTLNSNVLSLDLSFSGDVVVSLWVVDDLSFNWDVLNSFIDLFDWLFDHDGFFDLSSDIFNLGFNGIIVSNSSFNWDSFFVDDFFVFDDFYFEWDAVDLFDLIVLNIFFLKWDIFNSRFNWDFLSNGFLDGSINLGSSLGGSSVSI